MNISDRIYVAGHRGLVGSALVRGLKSQGYDNLLLKTRSELDLTDWNATRDFFEMNRPDYVFLAAAKVGGILANRNYPAEFILQNLSIQSNLIRAAQASKVKRLLFLGSSCIYPKYAEQPIKETSLLTGPLEPTNRAYALAKIAGIELCWSFNRQYGTQYLAVMPTNLYGPLDNYDLENSHVIPALIRKFHEAKKNSEPQVFIWGTGMPRREFMYSEDMADGCIFLMKLKDDAYGRLLGDTSIDGEEFNPPLINLGAGEDIKISDLSRLIKEIVGYEGTIQFDSTRPDGTPRKLMDNSRLKALGWSPKTDLRQGLEITYGGYVGSNRTQRITGMN